jgi:hypothetical protein
MEASKNSPTPKATFALLTIATVAAAVLYGLLTIGVGGNFGVEIGYYGLFNRVKRIFDESTEWKVKKSWVHEDISLEDFAFTLENNKGERVQLDFRESEIKGLPTDEKLLRAYVWKKVRLSVRGQDGTEIRAP